MNITRVERDGVEFFTIDATGESGISESGLARLCGVSRQSIHELLRSLVSGKSVKRAFEPTPGLKVWCQARGLSTTEKSNISNLSDRKSTRLNSSHPSISRMPSSA